MPKNLTGRNAIVTGASRGIGKAIAVALAREGVNLLITGRDRDALSQSEQEMSVGKVKINTIIVDFLDERSPEAVIHEAEKHFSKLDILINNAGTAYAGPIEKATPRHWEDLMNLNARSPFFLTVKAMDLLKKSDDPAVINISSVAGYKGYENQAIYSASKHALMGWSKAAARELAQQGIRIHVISPGATATGLAGEMRPDIDAEELIQPSAIAETVLFLLTIEGNAAVDEINIRRTTNIPWK